MEGLAIDAMRGYLAEKVCVQIKTHDPIAQGVSCLPLIRILALGYPETVARSAGPLLIATLSRAYLLEQQRNTGYATAAAYAAVFLAWDKLFTTWERKLPKKWEQDVGSRTEKPPPPPPPVDNLLPEKVCKTSFGIFSGREWCFADKDAIEHNKKVLERQQAEREYRDKLADNPYVTGSERILPMTRAEQRYLEMTSKKSKSTSE